jgi:lecithin:retinol acyltransferase
MNTELVPGTRLLVSRRGYRHHGIYAGSGRVIHYAGRGCYPLGCIEEIPLQQFVGRRALRVGIAPDVLRGSDIVERARSRLGECQYDLLRNNCEHFCNWCELGAPRSLQVESLALPIRLLLRLALTVEPRWQRFLRLISLRVSEAGASASMQAHATKWGAGATRWSDV